VAAGEIPQTATMELPTAKAIIRDLAAAGVSGISFTAGEPFIFFDDLLELITLCREHKIYSRIVTNCSWAVSPKKARQHLSALKLCGLSQLRMSYSRWHQQHVARQNIVNAAHECTASGIDYFISFVTDFSAEDDIYEDFLRRSQLKFFPEPVIYAGRADAFDRPAIHTDYQENRCAMNPYLAPDLNMYACCDAGSHFNTTDFFLLGNLRDHGVAQLFEKLETYPLFNCIRSQGITSIASFAGFKARDIVAYRKCELCEKIFNSPKMLEKMINASEYELPGWSR
jgi:hypothetical protein